MEAIADLIESHRGHEPEAGFKRKLARFFITILL
jgi:hypothetical protein